MKLLEALNKLDEAGCHTLRTGGDDWTIEDFISESDGELDEDVYYDDYTMQIYQIDDEGYHESVPLLTGLKD